jgi:two-component system phosphate regulon sensor histidine kinase PhoR
LLNPLLFEIWRLAGFLALAVIAGLLVDSVSLFVMLTLLSYSIWMLLRLYKLERWLAGKGKGNDRDIGGLQGEIYHHLYRLRKRNRKSKKKLAAIVNRFRESTNALPDATVVLGSNGKIDWWNDAAANALGLHHPADIGQRLTNLIRHPDFIKYYNRDVFTESITIPSPVNENIILSVRIIPYGNNQKLLIVRDITRMKLLEQMRSDFIANVSHELRTPLTVISGYLESIMDDDDEFAKKYKTSFESMQQQSTRMQSIVTDLLTLSRLETKNDVPFDKEVDVPALLGMIHDDASALSDGNHKINIDVDRDLLLRGSNDDLRSAFSNLVYNAVRYTPSGGVISMRWYADDRGAHFEVKDTGVGFSKKHIPRLTERFYRVDVGRSREKGGTGLGLAIVKHILSRHKASLYIDSEPGQGSTFRCDFPNEYITKRTIRAVK